MLNIDGQEVRFFHAFKKGVHRVFIDHPWFLAKVRGSRLRLPSPPERNVELDMLEFPAEASLCPRCMHGRTLHAMSDIGCA